MARRRCKATVHTSDVQNMLQWGYIGVILDWYVDNGRRKLKLCSNHRALEGLYGDCIGIVAKKLEIALLYLAYTRVIQRLDRNNGK